MTGYITKVTEKKETFDTGSVRSSQEGRPRYDLIPTGPLRRLAELYARGAEKYGERNWEKGQPDERLIASMLRHVYAGIDNVQDGEDHWAGVLFNVMALMYFQDKRRMAETQEVEVHYDFSSGELPTPSVQYIYESWAEGEMTIDLPNVYRLVPPSNNPHWAGLSYLYPLLDEVAEFMFDLMYSLPTIDEKKTATTSFLALLVQDHYCISYELALRYVVWVAALSDETFTRDWEKDTITLNRVA